MVLLWDLVVEGGIRRGGGKEGRGSGLERRGRGVRRGGGCKGVGGGGGEWRFLCRLHGRFLCRLLVLGGGGRGKASGGINRGGEGEGALAPPNARIVAGEPREAEHQLEVRKGCKLEGKVFCVAGLNAKVG